MSSDVDWTKGLRITGEKMDQDLMEKAEEGFFAKSGKSTGKMEGVVNVCQRAN